MATVTKPVALDESFNSTEATPRSVADVLADELVGIKQAITNQGGGGSGHTIQNASGSNMPQENTMQFKDSHVTDNSGAGKTEVEVIKSVASADYPSETEDGLYVKTDTGDAVIKKGGTDYPIVAQTASNINYNNTQSGLSATKVQGAIDEVNDNKANKTDLTNISQSGATATQAIASGTYFYLNGTLVRAKTAIASGATFTLNTNYEVVTAGGLNDLSEQINSKIPVIEETTITMSVAAGYTEHATYSFPEKWGYSRAMTVVQNLSGSGSATCSVHLNGAPWTGDVFVYSPSAAASLTITLRCLYLPSI